MTRTNESKHDRTVRTVAEELEADEWNVVADLPDFDRPEPIGQEGRIPDVVATKRGHTRIVEVETPQSKNKDKAQQTTFRRSAAQRRNTKFTIVETD